MFEKMLVIDKYGTELYSFGNSEKVKTIDSQLIASFIITLQQMSEDENNPISSIKLQNYVIYINTYTDYTIVLIVSKKISESLITSIFNDLSSIILYNYNKIIKNSVNDNFENIIKTIISPIDSDEAIVLSSTNINFINASKKVGIVGLANAGKTSLKKKCFGNLVSKDSDLIEPTDGIQISKNKLPIIGEEIIIADFGGQKDYRNQYLTNPETFDNFLSLLFIIDIQQPHDFQEAKNYFENILNIIDKKFDKPTVSIFIHKFDSRSEDILRNLEELLNIFKEYLKNYSYYFSTIYDTSSTTSLFNVLFLSLSDIIVKFILERLLLDKLHSTLLNESKVNEVKDENSELLFFRGLQIGSEISKEFQKIWLESYMGNYKPTTRELTSKEVLFTHSNKKIAIEIENWEEIEIPQEKSDQLITGALKGLFNTLFINNPIQLDHRENKTIWSINY